MSDKAYLDKKGLEQYHRLLQKALAKLDNTKANKTDLETLQTEVNKKVDKENSITETEIDDLFQ